jgi:ribose/xylose/arabinose/galactoside ABC-type transport system permease subunit
MKESELTIERRINIKKKFVNFFYSQAMLIILIVLFIIMSLVSENFLTLSNIYNLFRQVAVLGIMACGMTVVVIGKGIDLSAAAIVGLASVANVMLQKYGFYTGVFVAIAVGVICGLINGYFIGKVKANFIIVTLATQILFTATALIISEARNLTSRPFRIYSYIGSESIFGFPVIILFLIIIMVINGILLQKTIPGRRLYAVGLNDKAALVAGINSSNVIMGSYIINGLLCGIASVVLTSRISRVRVGQTAPYLFDTITIVVLGGTALTGGVGSIYYTALGLVIFGVINNSMGILAVPFEYQQLIKGIILIMAVLYDEFNRRRRLLY